MTAWSLKLTLGSVMLASILNGQTEPVTLGWLSGVPQSKTGVSWGVPWAQGRVLKSQAFRLTAADGKDLPLQSWPMAYWPDGSLKWTGFATVASPAAAGPLKLIRGDAPPPAAAVRVSQSADAIEIDTGILKARLPRQGPALIDSFTIDGRIVARRGRLVCTTEDRSEADKRIYRYADFTSQIKNVTVEQSGPVRAVVKFEGVHRADAGSREWLPFVVRLYFYSGEESVRMVHSIIFDGDAQKDFIKGLGVAFAVPMREQVHNRHVRFSGEGSGLWAEPLQPLTGRGGLTMNGRNMYTEQIAGRKVPNREEFDRRGQALMNDWAVWDSYKLTQTSADGFRIEKRTNPQSSWLHAGDGKRASGLVFTGDVSGGLGIGLKNFWQSYPASLEVEKASTNEAELRVWMWSPEAAAMDLRHYDTKGHGLDAAYEDVQPGFSTPHGVARTSELTLFPKGGLPDKEETVKLAHMGARPPLLVATPQHLHSVRAFGIWSLPDRSTAGKKWIEEQLDQAFSLYQKEVEQRHWYGFWNYGDVMHGYDAERHTWRYDIGGYAWANTELMPDLWLWYSFLRTGRDDIFRMAEAMTRHTGEVDVYHLGRFAGLGSRHNVSHWGCGAKEVRISQAALKRFYHYLTTDERAGDLMREVVNADQKMVEIDPVRILNHPSRGAPTHARVGPDWLALVGNWMTEWERTGDSRWRDKALAGVRSLAKMKYGVFTGKESTFGYDPKTGEFSPIYDEGIGTLHLMALMGGPEVAFEFTPVLNSPEWNKLWLQYTQLYSAPREDVMAAFGQSVALGTPTPHFARMPAYAYMVTKDAKYAQRAWDAFLGAGRPQRSPLSQFATRRVEGPHVLNPLDESPGVSTNNTAQWCLNAIEILEMVGDKMPAESPQWTAAPAGRD